MNMNECHESNKIKPKNVNKGIVCKYAVKYKSVSK